ncbi:UbiA family prenyltransferase [Bradyrhizobium sp. CCBAU 53338]|uniref:UbiA family prenyltransferase n=1 Tax=Bradyrhizobium sp. CCBAU 53338 TaxID=1325111 RepID=UPI001FEDC3BB|nr:UbiA family prenyltransferase [Bradyrhizobium sp. CCBAU 53338]
MVELADVVMGGDLSLQSIFALLGKHPAGVFELLMSFCRAEADTNLSAPRSTLDISLLPYNKTMLAQIRQVLCAGRRVYLISDEDRWHTQRIADHLGLFAGVIINDDRDEPNSKATLEMRLAKAFGAGGFERLTLPITASRSWVDLLERMRLWTRLFRVHQWSKNALVFVPLITAHQFELLAFGHAATAFVGFSLAASGIYIVNDLVDIDADRNHPRKRSRPIAAGSIRASHGLIAAVALVTIAIMAASSVSPLLTAVLGSYLCLTIAYSFVLKRKMLLDVIALAALYTIRVVGGAVAISVPSSEWLLGFSMFVFMALALIKRYVELTTGLDADLPDPANRNYKRGDLTIVASLAAAASFNAVTVFALYISSETVHRLYRHPYNLWLICPILMYWLGRALMMAHRREMDDDPILFALKDRNSVFLFVLVGVILLSAI